MIQSNHKASVEIEASGMEVLKGIMDVHGWWSENLTGDTKKQLDEFTHLDRYLKVTFWIKTITNQKVIWKVISSYNNMFLDNPREWEATLVEFSLAQSGKNTRVDFTHFGLNEELECHGVCSSAWNYFITTSLKNLVEQGTGSPIKKEIGSYSTCLETKITPASIFKAIRNISGWLPGCTNKEDIAMNDLFEMKHEVLGEIKMKIIEMNYPKSIVCLFKNVDENDLVHEIAGSTIIFEIKKVDKQTALYFTHLGLIPKINCYHILQGIWNQAIQVSLKRLIDQESASQKMEQ